MTAPSRAGDTCFMTVNTPYETGDMLVVTFRVPCTDLDELSLDVDKHTVSVSAAGGFRHEVQLPPEADMDRLGAELFRGILELRAPRETGL